MLPYMYHCQFIVYVYEMSLCEINWFWSGFHAYLSSTTQLVFSTQSDNRFISDRGISLLMLIIKEASKLHIIGIWDANSPVTGGFHKKGQ